MSKTELLNYKLYPAPHWGPDSYWELYLYIDTAGELHMGEYVVRCDPLRKVVRRMPVGRSTILESQQLTTTGLKKARTSIQRHLYDLLVKLTWEDDLDAFGAEFWRHENE